MAQTVTSAFRVGVDRRAPGSLHNSGDRRSRSHRDKGLAAADAKNGVDSLGRCIGAAMVELSTHIISLVLAVPSDGCRDKAKYPFLIVTTRAIVGSIYNEVRLPGRCAQGIDWKGCLSAA
jgi:hypothetical protein